MILGTEKTDSKEAHDRCYSGEWMQKAWRGFVPPEELPEDWLAVSYCDSFATFTWFKGGDKNISEAAERINSKAKIKFTYIYTAVGK